jgi:hypothetical protein
MKVKHWISFSLASLVFVSLVGTITKNQATEQAPSAIARSASPLSMPQQMAQSSQQPTVIKSGNFQSGEHPTQGKAQIITQNGQSFLELNQGFKTSTSGPDLVVVLHRSNNVLNTTTPPAYPLQEGDYIVLAPLQKFNGAQRYAIPTHVNLANFQSAAIWCRAFNATFGAATLSS